MTEIRTAKRSKSLFVEPIDDTRVRFVLALEDTSSSAEGKELIHSLEVSGVLALPTLEILEIEPRAVHHPYEQCSASLAPVRAMVGTRIGPGFRARVIEIMGRTLGCTHFMTLVLDLGAAHTLTTFLRMRKQAKYAERSKPGGDWMRVGLRLEPRLENACIALRSDSPVIAQVRRETDPKREAGS